MTSAKDFQNTAKIALIRIITRSPLADYSLMELLGFSPPSWKTWKPLLMQKLTTGVHEHVDSNGTFQYKITYDKKQRIWNSAIENSTQQS